MSLAATALLRRLVRPSAHTPPPAAMLATRHLRTVTSLAQASVWRASSFAPGITPRGLAGRAPRAAGLRGFAARPEGEERKSAAQWPRPNHPYGWIDAEAESLIAKAYARHRALADTGSSFPPSISIAELERIDTPSHYTPRTFGDKVALGFMKFIRQFVHAFFREKYDHHAVCLETVAAIPGMVGAFHRHFRSLRRMERDNNFINPLLEESENERMREWQPRSREIPAGRTRILPSC
jgi:Alternative oxidase